jgi:para-aminobenzoate synthetase component 1
MHSFFCHIPYSAERGLGIIAQGVKDCFVFSDNIKKEEWQNLDVWIEKNKGQWILSISSFESGFCFLQIPNNKEDITLAPKGVWVVPQEIECYYSSEKNPSADWSKNAQFEGLQSEQEYIDVLEKINFHLQRGDIYETNYCTFLTSALEWSSPYDIWKYLYALNPTPFGIFWKWDQHFLLCLSPERFIQKIGDKLISQPIKGTIRRGSNEEEDEQLKTQLQQHPKERNENVMIVDLVRNDLSKIATKASVVVTDLCGIYSFPKIHHMISTVECNIPAATQISEIFEAMFPMGSMTGVPKKRAVDLMHALEVSARGWYSGTAGYIDPNGNFDFNVIIRSIHYNQEKNLGKIGIGSAITLQSDRNAEWKECWLKAQSLLQPLSK